MKNILVGGVYYGCHNIGDDAILQAILDKFSVYGNIQAYTDGSDFLKDTFNNVRFAKIPHVFGRPILGYRYTPRTNPLKVLSELSRIKSDVKETDLAIIGGGTILSDCPWYSLGLARYIKALGIPTILFGAGMAELGDNGGKDFICKTLNTMDGIFVRDEFVKMRLKNMGVSTSNLDVCYDPALLLQPASDVWPLPQEENQIYVGVSISAENDVKDKINIELFSKVLDQVVFSNSVKIIFVPTCTRPGMDIDVMRAIRDKCKYKESMYLIETEYTPRELISLCRNLSLVVSSRLHFNILASIVGIPSIGLVRNEKLVDFAKLIGTSDLLVEFTDIKSILKKVEISLKRREIYRNKILNQINYMRNQHDRMIEFIAEKYL